jgi:hypothetical protein
MRVHFGVAICLLTGGCSNDCGTTIVSAQIAPDSTKKAVLSQRDCGATTGFSTQVSIIDLNGSPDDGVVFRADDNHGKAFVGNWNGPWVETKWLGPDRLVIRYAVDSRIFTKSEKGLGVTIAYEAVSNLTKPALP